MNQETKLSNAIGFQKLAVSSTAVGFTASNYRLKTTGSGATTGPVFNASYALITVDGTAGTNDIVWRCDGTDPTADTGHRLKSGETLVIHGFTNISKFKAIRAGSDTTIQATFFMSN